LDPHDHTALLDPASGVFFLLEGDVRDLVEVCDQARGGNPSAEVRTLRGEKCRTVAGFYDEIARSLEIPYDSISWNVLNEALFDLTWLPASAYLLAIEDAHLFLASEGPNQLEIWNRIMDGDLPRYTSSDAPRVPRKVLMQCPPGEAPALIQRLKLEQAP
jgi:hypothetical protein